MSDVTMPQLGETVTEGTITKWMKSVGETVARDEPLFEVSTDKVDTEVPAPASGVVSQILVLEGETVSVGTLLAVIGAEGGAEGAAQGAAATPAPAAATPAAPPSEAPPASPAAAPAPAAPVSAPAASGGEGTSAPLLSPVVRKLLSDNAIDPASVVGTGPGGRITRADVQSVIERGGNGRAAVPASAMPTAPAPASWPTTPVPTPAALAPTPSAAGSRRPERDETIPFSNIRRRTAEHMLRSKATSPHALVSKEVDYENVERVRRAEGDRFKEEEGFTLTYLPFVARAVVEALHSYPLMNASVVEDALVVHRDINLGVAVDLEHQGLIVPVVHNAEELTLRGMARRIKDLADRARSRGLSANDISGGTLSITNAGPFGTFLTMPIINQPQVAILSTDGVSRKPVVVTAPDGSEAIAIHSMGVLGVAFDHRAIDGAYAAAFVSEVAAVLAGHTWSTEL